MPPRGGRDEQTLDLLQWEPPKVEVRRFEEAQVRSGTLRDRIARGVSQTLREYGEKDREQIAADMAAFLDEDVSKGSLDAYASQAREDHSISYVRLLALIHATGDIRLLQLGAELFGLILVDSSKRAWIEAGQLADMRDELAKKLDEVNRLLDGTVRNARRGGGR